MKKIARYFAFILAVTVCQLPLFGSSTGDVNGDGTVDVADIFFFINYVFADGAAPAPHEHRSVTSFRFGDPWSTNPSEYIEPISLPHGSIVHAATLTFSHPFPLDWQRCSSETFEVRLIPISLSESASTQISAEQTLEFTTGFEDGMRSSHAITIQNLDQPVDNNNYVFDLWLTRMTQDACGQAAFPLAFTVEYTWD